MNTGSPIAVFYGKSQKNPRRFAGWYWDDAENHGTGQDVSPQGPFGDFDAAKQNALDTCGVMRVSEIIEGVPAHYPRDWSV